MQAVLVPPMPRSCCARHARRALPRGPARRDVPFAVERDRSYYRRRETIDAAALVRAALDPADPLALVTCCAPPRRRARRRAAAALAGGAAGDDDRPGGAVGSDFIRALRRARTGVGGRASGVSGLDRFADWPRAAGAALEALLERRAAFERASGDVWVDGLRRAFLPEAVAAARYRRATGSPTSTASSASSPPGSRTEWPRIACSPTCARPSRSDPTPPRAAPWTVPTTPCAVMTLHSAKGLEFREVYLAGLHHEVGGRQRAPSFAAERVDERWEYRLFGAPTPGLAPAADLEERIRAAEQVRLLYVGMTRAVRRLVLSGALPFTREAADPSRARSLAQLFAGRLPETGLAAEVAAAAGAGWRDGEGVVWRLLPPPHEVEPSGRTADGSTPDDAAEALARCVDLRTAAFARRARPRISRVTELAEWAAEPVRADDGPPDALPVDEKARDWALARGAALHRALELAPLASAEPERWRAAATAALERELTAIDDRERRRFAADLDRLLASRLFRRLAELEPRIVAREVPLLLATCDPDPPLDAVTGAIDLVYLDPATGEPVIADFKSDAVADDEVAALVARYAPQLDLYARAVVAALGLEAPPRRELWLLALDRIEPLDSALPAAAPVRI